MIALRINDQWAVLDQNQSVSIEENSPVWGEGNTFSFPFELNAEANRHILGNVDQLTGMSVYDHLEGKPAVLYVMGIPFFYGVIALEDEVEIVDGTIEVSLISSTLAFNKMIDGMNCQDVELTQEIVLGTGVNCCYFYNEMFNQSVARTRWDGLSKEMMAMKVDGKSTVNVTEPYPAAKYCNVRIQYQKPDSSTESALNSDADFKTCREIGERQYEPNKYSKYIVLEADRPLSGTCYFVLYFLECLFVKLGIDFDFSKINGNGDINNDINRLAFFSTRFSCDAKSTGRKLTRGAVKTLVPSFEAFIEFAMTSEQYGEVKYIANSKGFPNVEVTEVIDSLINGFGIRFLYDPSDKIMKTVYVKDVLRNQEIKDFGYLEVIDVFKQENNVRGFLLEYSAGGDEDTAFEYDDWSNIEQMSSYADIKKKVAPYNSKLYISSTTGNAYRIKINKEAKTTAELNPSLFKIAQFNKVEYGDCSNEERVEKIEIPFVPIVQNDVSPDGDDPTYATFVDESLLAPSLIAMPSVRIPYVWESGEEMEDFMNYGYTFYSAQRTSGSSSEKRVYSHVNSLVLESEYAFQSYDAGLTLGIMRGPGADASVREYDEDYDGEGNAKYMTVAANYAFHADTIDDNGGEFDYNGDTEGGTGTEDGTEGRFSLYLRAEKPNPEGGYFEISTESARRRGLFDKFYTEYAHFVTHRKIARFTLRMEVAELVNIDWTKRYRIGEFVGFINHFSYTVSASGISEVQLDLYYM